jgi:hypothetical protein
MKVDAKTKKKMDALLKVAGTPADSDSRSCFGIKFFDTIEKATAYAEYISLRGDTYNGGFFHGMSCGRDAGFDYKTKDGVQLFAVSTR